MRAVIDLEANGLKPDTIWCIVCRDVDNPEVPYVFENVSENPRPFLDFSRRVDSWVGHNIINYDLPALSICLAKVLGPMDLDRFRSNRAIDTLVVSRFLNVAISGGHSLEAWGNRFGIQKSGTDIRDWSKYDPSMLQRCLSDTEINVRLYEYFLPYIQRDDLRSGLRIEHDAAQFCRTLHDNGFEFDLEGARGLKELLEVRLKEIDDSLVVSFPSSVVLLKEFTPKVTSKGTLTQKDFFWIPKEYRNDLTFFKADETYSLVSLEPFNPGSIKQIIERMWDAGWKPTEKTDGHIEFLKSREDDPERRARFEKYGWKICDANLLTLPDTAPPAARRLVERILLASRVSDLDEWIAAVESDGRVHGQFTGIGAWTHRMSHARPNMANIPKSKPSDKMSDLDKFSNDVNDTMRSLWRAPKGKILIGTDADGIQMRVFAHYVNDERLTNALITGDKKQRTDIHSVHQRALGSSCLSRDHAKTFIYAWLLGAGVGKVAEILECSSSEAKSAVQQFLEFYPSLRKLKEKEIPADARRGYFLGLDKRPVICDNEHMMLAGYLQNGEVLVMKYAARIWNERLQRENIPYRWVNFVHDEWQTEVPDNREIADYVGRVQVEAIIQAGLDLEMNCPLNGETKIGYNWKDTH